MHERQVAQRFFRLARQKITLRPRRQHLHEDPHGDEIGNGRFRGFLVVAFHPRMGTLQGLADERELRFKLVAPFEIVCNRVRRGHGYFVGIAASQFDPDSFAVGKGRVSDGFGQELQQLRRGRRALTVQQDLRGANFLRRAQHAGGTDRVHDHWAEGVFEQPGRFHLCLGISPLQHGGATGTGGAGSWQDYRQFGQDQARSVGAAVAGIK